MLLRRLDPQDVAAVFTAEAASVIVKNQQACAACAQSGCAHVVANKQLVNVSWECKVLRMNNSFNGTI